jgi:hypothetical protein
MWCRTEAMNELDQTVTRLALCWKVPFRNAAETPTIGGPSFVVVVLSHTKVMPCFSFFLLRLCIFMFHLRVIPCVMMVVFESVRK